jgi:hypothetical protein
MQGHALSDIGHNRENIVDIPWSAVRHDTNRLGIATNARVIVFCERNTLRDQFEGPEVTGLEFETRYVSTAPYTTHLKDASAIP